MKRKRYGFLDPGMIMGVVVSLIILAVGVFAVFTVANEMSIPEEYVTDTTTTTYTETFETDTNATNPDDTWYTYTETGWEWANVTNLTAKTGSCSYRINRTNDSGGENSYSNFTVASNDYEYFQLWFKWRNDSHNFTRLAPVCDDAWICMFDIGGTVASGKTETVVFYNYSGVWQSSVLDNDTWYRVRADFNWTTSTIRARLFNGAGTTLNDSGYIPMYDGSLTFDNMDTIIFRGYTTNPAYIWFDDFALSDSDTTIGGRPDIVGTANSVFNIIGILLIIGAIMAIIGIVMKFQK